MTLRNIFESIEKPQFAFGVTLESTFRRILLNIGSQPLTGRLIDLIREGGGNAEDILNRLVQLSQQSTDPRYENPYDIAFTVYLYALQQLRPDLAKLGAEVAIRLPGAWWSFKLAQAILTPNWASTSSGDTFFTPIGQELGTVPTSTTIDAFFISSVATSIFKLTEETTSFHADLGNTNTTGLTINTAAEGREEAISETSTPDSGSAKSEINRLIMPPVQMP